MNLARAVALVAFVLAGLSAMGWLLSQNVAHAVALIAFGLALEVLAGVAVIPGRG